MITLLSAALICLKLKGCSVGMKCMTSSTLRKFTFLFFLISAALFSVEARAMLSFETHLSGEGEQDRGDGAGEAMHGSDGEAGDGVRPSMADGKDGVDAYIARPVKPKRTVKRRKRLSPLDVKEDEEDVHQVTAKLIRGAII
jgi:hypothetical protein